MNRHYKKRTVKILKPVYIAYRDYAKWTSCSMIYGVFENLDKAIGWIKWDAEFNKRCGYKIKDITNYNDIEDVGVPLGNRIGAVYEIQMNTTGKRVDGNTHRYVVFQTYMNRPAV